MRIMDKFFENWNKEEDKLFTAITIQRFSTTIFGIYHAAFMYTQMWNFKFSVHELGEKIP